MREKFNAELTALKQEVLEMGRFALDMLCSAVQSLKDQDLALADRIYHQRKKLAQYDQDLEDRALKLIALYQPLAKDLRTIACVLKLNTYLLQIGRYGKDISNVTKELKDTPHFKKLISIPQMCEIVCKMVQDALLAFETENLEGIKDLAARDDEVDEMRFSIFRELISYMMEDPKVITQSAHYLLVARYIERCGDHACKMAEKIHYMVTGEHIEVK